MKDKQQEKATTGMTTEEQVESWKTELIEAMAEQQWQQALKFCSWIRYTLGQQGRTDPQVEQVHQQAKETLGAQVAHERAQRGQQKAHLRLRHMCLRQINAEKWIPALDSIESLHQQNIDQEDTLSLLNELRTRLSKQLSAPEWRMSPQATAVSQRFNEVVEQVRSTA